MLDPGLNISGRVLQGLGCIEGGNLAEEGSAHLGGELLLAPCVLAYIVAQVPVITSKLQASGYSNK